jgi:hypothetical protein
MATKGFAGSGSPDEFPLASTMEGGKGAQITDVPVGEQRIQGGIVSRFYQNAGVQRGDQFMFEVRDTRPTGIPYRRGAFALTGAESQGYAWILPAFLPYTWQLSGVTDIVLSGPP